MGQDTKIQWATHTFNPWRGCDEEGPGCDNCYAREMAKRNPKMLGVWGSEGTRVVASEAMWKAPLKWQALAAAERFAYESELPLHDDGNLAPPERPRVFCASLGDVFEDWKGPMLDARGDELIVSEQGNWISWEDCMGHDEPALRMADVRRRLFELIDQTPHLDWLLVTKRPQNILRMWPMTPGIPGNLVQADGSFEFERPTQLMFRPNVWLLTSIACQEDADKTIPELLKCRDLVPVLGISAEPLIGPVDLEQYLPLYDYRPTYPHWQAVFGGDGQPVKLEDGIDWVICGGESGGQARPFNVEWARYLRDQCQSANVAFFLKQLGSVPYLDSHKLDEWALKRDRQQLAPGLGYQVKLADKKGGDPAEWPEDLRVREMPEVVR